MKLTSDHHVTTRAAIVRDWAADGRSHRGLVLTDDSSWSWAPERVGRYIEALDAFLSQHPEDDSFNERVHWLQAPCAAFRIHVSLGTHDGRR